MTVGISGQENQSFPIKCATKLSIARMEMMINFCESLSRSQDCSRCVSECLLLSRPAGRPDQECAQWTISFPKHIIIFPNINFIKIENYNFQMEVLASFWFISKVELLELMWHYSIKIVTIWILVANLRLVIGCLFSTTNNMMEIQCQNSNCHNFYAVILH